MLRGGHPEGHTLLAVAQQEWFACTMCRASSRMPSPCMDTVWTTASWLQGKASRHNNGFPMRVHVSTDLPADLLVVGSNTYCSCTRAAQLIFCHAIGERALRCKAICLCGPCV